MIPGWNKQGTELRPSESAWLSYSWPKGAHGSCSTGMYRPVTVLKDDQSNQPDRWSVAYLSTPLFYRTYRDGISNKQPVHALTLSLCQK